ncbi:hypothetical protein [Qipengyuania spongiae]|uniref:Lipoprotein n=1 Tax=Qipengyuania spongiae TaxID=2909673 RepID=A0ABY5SYI8_9SPHN|nr:hypothetical protein [Qipengyuania spongiae]UVI38146.1 hypothetical protein L1F33_07620 [Qipengyuania spongiae]
MRAQFGKTVCIGALASFLAACSPAESGDAQQEVTAAEPAALPSAAATSEAAIAANRFTAWEGRWTGVEGMYVDIKPNGDGTFTLDMQSDLDTKGTYQGVPVENGIRFERGGEEFVLRAGNGEQTGLKWLLDKEDCLVVAEGEGYCRG